MILLWIAISVVPVGWLVLSFGPHYFTRRPPNGSARDGVVVFVESIRWLSMPWGKRTVARGLRKAGFRGRFLYWRWHSTWRGWLVLPAIMDTALLERESQRLAEFLERLNRRQPNRPVHLIGYSCGAYVAVRAMELLPTDVCVESAATLEGAFSPGFDLAPACKHVSRRLVICSSVLDCFITGIGTWVFGTADQVHTFSAAVVGTRCEHPCIQQIRWRPGMIRFGHIGGHFTASCVGFVREFLAPAMGITNRENISSSPRG